MVHEEGRDFLGEFVGREGNLLLSHVENVKGARKGEKNEKGNSWQVRSNK